jgi:hypothetical protein
VFDVYKSFFELYCKHFTTLYYKHFMVLIHHCVWNMIQIFLCEYSLKIFHSFLITGDKNIWKYVLLSSILIVCLIGIVILSLISWRTGRVQNIMPWNNSMKNFYGGVSLVWISIGPNIHWSEFLISSTIMKYQNIFRNIIIYLLLYLIKF